MRIVTLEQTCGACPSQWEGRLADVRHVYIRSRHDWLTVGVGNTIDDAVDARWSGAPEGSELVVNVEDGAGGYLPQTKMLEILAQFDIEVRA